MKKFFIAPASLTTARRFLACSAFRAERNCSTAADRARVRTFCSAACLPEVELRSMSLNSARSVRRMSKFGRARAVDLWTDTFDVCCCAASDFHNGKATAATATERTVKIQILRIICASFGFVGLVRVDGRISWVERAHRLAD